MSMGATQRLASYATRLKYGDIPGDVIASAKACALDTLAVTLYGATKPWSRQVVTHVRSVKAKGRCTVLGARWSTHPSLAALANGTMAHAFELDSVRQPGAGVHPGATAFLPALALAEYQRASGKDLLTAFVAACEVVCRIGVAAGNSLERRGFHAPALTGTFAAAVAAGKLLGLNETQMVNALGIAGSYSGGLMEFSLSHGGAMIKRLHLGKAAEGGVTAALLARSGFTGPASVLEGKFGFCESFSATPALDSLTAGLGRVFETLNTGIKSYACHINAHAPIEALLQLREQHGFAPDDIREIVIGGIEKLVTHHAIYKPQDLMAAQYSLPFCVALSLHFDPRDPASFTERRLKNRAVRKTSRLVRLQVDREIEHKGWDRAARVTVKLKGKESLTALTVHFKGAPRNPLSPLELQEKVRRLTRHRLSEKKLNRVMTLVDQIEKLKNLSQLTAQFKSL